LIDEEIWCEVEKQFDQSWAKQYDLIGIHKKLFSESSHIRKRAIGSLVHPFITSAIIKEMPFNDPLLKYRVVLMPEAYDGLDKLKTLIKDKIINLPEVQTLEYRGQQIVMQLFEAISSDPKRLLKRKFLPPYEEAKTYEGSMRIISDYVAGMTDEYATRLYERLFMPRHGTVFQRL